MPSRDGALPLQIFVTANENESHEAGECILGKAFPSEQQNVGHLMSVKLFIRAGVVTRCTEHALCQRALERVGRVHITV